MLARYVQRGESIDYRPGEKVNAGDVIIQGNLPCVAKLDIEAGYLGAVSTAGVYEIVKDATAFAAGVAVYWNPTSKTATLSSEGAKYIGKTVAAAEATAGTAYVLLNAPSDYVTSSGGGSAIANLTDNCGGVASDTIAQADTGSKDAVSSLAAKVNAILVALRTAGIIKG